MPARPPGRRHRHPQRVCCGPVRSRGRESRSSSPDDPGRTIQAARAAATAGDPGSDNRGLGRSGLLFRRSSPRWQPGRHTGMDRPVPGRPGRRGIRTGLLQGPQRAYLARLGHPRRDLCHAARYSAVLVPGNHRRGRSGTGDRRSLPVHGSDGRIPIARLPGSADGRDAAGMACAPTGTQGASGRTGRSRDGGRRRGRAGPSYRCLPRTRQTRGTEDLPTRAATGDRGSGS